MANFAVDQNDVQFAAMLCLGFFGLLRTGEMVQVAARDIMIGSTAAIVRLVDTKTGKRNTANEVVSIEDPFSLEILKAAKHLHPFPNTPLWNLSSQTFRAVFARYCERFDLQQLQFRPYSLRRGGATDLFQVTGSMEKALVKGRWSSSKVARVYISDGLSYLPSIIFSRKARVMLRTWGPFNH